MDKPAFQQLQAQLVKRPPVESLRATGGCTLEIHRQVLKGRLRGQRADASTGHAEAFAADSCSDLLVFLLDMNNAPFVIDSVFISLSLIEGAYQSAAVCSSLSKNLVEFRRRSGERKSNHFLRRHVRRRKYFSGCKCGICAPAAHKFHTCSLSSIFSDAHVAGENG